MKRRITGQTPANEGDGPHREKMRLDMEAKAAEVQQQYPLPHPMGPLVVSCLRYSSNQRTLEVGERGMRQWRSLHQSRMLKGGLQQQWQRHGHRHRLQMRSNEWYSKKVV